MIRAVLDTNVWISAFLKPDGVPGLILHAWREKRFEVIVSEDILSEIGRVLIEPKIQKRGSWSADEVKDILFLINKNSLMIPARLSLKVIKDDPSDDRFFNAAVEGGAKYIVSGDVHLQKIREYRGIRVLSPAVFLTRLKLKERKKTKK